VEWRLPPKGRQRSRPFVVSAAHTVVAAVGSLRRNIAVIYETSFGTTREVAEQIADTLGATVLSVDDPPPGFTDLDLLVVGSPTHGSAGSSRLSAGSAWHAEDRLDDLPGG
jgi:hypothetical protein